MLRDERSVDSLSMTTNRLRLLTSAALVVALAGCSSATDRPPAAAPASVTTAASAAPVAVPDEPRSLLARHGLDGLSTTQVIDRLDRMSLEDRPAPEDLKASVRPNELVVSGEEEELHLSVPDDRFYLSVAPYVDHSHDCFYHSLTSCKGELGSKEMRVEIVDEVDDRVLVDEMRTTFENGFVGLWLPRDLKATLRVTFDGKVGETGISTGGDAPTCLTSLRLT